MGWLKRRLCDHVLEYVGAEPIYAVRWVRDTPENRIRWFGWVLGEHTCPECGADFLNLRIGGKPL